jgi:hypothetical protein
MRDPLAKRQRPPGRPYWRKTEILTDERGIEVHCQEKRKNDQKKEKHSILKKSSGELHCRISQDLDWPKADANQ